MKINALALTFSVVLCSIIMSFIIPYPTLNSMLLTTNQQKYINDLYEEEQNVTTSITIMPVLNLNWFDFMNSYFTKYEPVRVIDIYSMKEYYVKRMGGYNHADVQTIDSKNTQIFKEIYGGVWSWTRRPVWVEIDGKFYAGSSNGMPHGFDILQTGEGGHTCIHFLNSKTHGTKRVDEAHQKCVEYASKHQDLLNEYLAKK